MPADHDPQLVSDDYEAAIAAARAYCATIDARRTVEFDTFLVAVHRDVSELYARTLALALVEIDSSDAEYESPQTDVWTELYRDLQSLLGPLDTYREVYHPYQDEDAITGSLADALATVYEAALRAIAVAEKLPIADAAEALQLQFGITLGHHALDVMRAIHAHRFEPGHAPDDSPEAASSS